MQIYLAGNTIFPHYIAPVLLGGGEIKYNATLPRRTAYDNEVQGRKKSCDETLDGGYP